ncbi:MAG: methyltransferase domain-containing protein, partial [Miltoncostaeaceae bacterium]
MGRLSAPGPALAELDEDLLRDRVAELYTGFTSVPAEDLHFEIGRGLATALGYSPTDLGLVPDTAADAFAGVGHHIDLADLADGEDVLDIGVGSGTDAMIAAHRVGSGGTVVGVDPTEAQADRTRAATEEAGVRNLSVRSGRAEALPVDDASTDVVMSNGVINLVPDKDAAFTEIARVLRPGGRVALSDIVSEQPIGARARCNVNLWAECVAGAEPLDDYLDAIAAAGLS